MAFYATYFDSAGGQWLAGIRIALALNSKELTLGTGLKSEMERCEANESSPGKP